MARQVHIVLTGGGSGGHVYPALAIGEIAGKKFPGARFLYIGTRRGAESGIVPARGMDIAYITIESFRKNFFALALFGGVLLRATRQSYGILKKFRPDLIIATGGYSSAPVLLAGALQRKFGGSPKIFIHEQNVVAGLANRLGGKLADRIATTFRKTGKYFPPGKTVHVGYPVRSRAAPSSRGEARAGLGIGENAFVVFAFGGSAGSRTVNRAVVDALETLLADDRACVIHATGRYRGSDYDPKTDTAGRLEKKKLSSGQMERYHLLDYTEEIGKYYSACDVAVSRCGSGTLFELKKAGIPAVLLPKIGSAQEHQLHNALAMEEEGAALVLKERQDKEEERGVMKVEGSELARKILDLKKHPGQLERMSRLMKESGRPDTSEMIGSVLAEMMDGC